MSKKVLAFIMIAFLFLVGIGGWQVQKKNLEIQTLQTQLTQLKEQVAISSRTEKTEEKKNINFPIYTANSDTYKPEVKHYIELPDDTEVEDKLKLIARELSRTYFGGLPIEVMKVEAQNGKKVAIVNLKEIPNCSSQISWARKYFQGSYGGTMTTTQLVESFLQREYTGEWIDGVQILYENRTVEYEHVPELQSVVFRQ